MTNLTSVGNFKGESENINTCMRQHFTVGERDHPVYLQPARGDHVINVSTAIMHAVHTQTLSK